MIRFDQPDRCAFCGQLIAPGEPMSGRGETAAHVTCADAALGDDRFWDRIAAGLGDAEPAGPGASSASRSDRAQSDGTAPAGPAGAPDAPNAARRAGCGLAVVLSLIAAAVIAVRR